MAILNIQFTPEAGYGGIYRAIAYTSAAPAIPVAQQDFNAPHPTPIIGALNVPTFEEYIVKIFARACNDKLVGQIILTPPVATCQVPSNIIFSNITSNSFTASWMAPPSIPSNGYDWILYEVVGVTETQIQSGNTTNTSINFSSLNSGTHYKLRVKSNCGSSTSNSVIGETDTTTMQPVVFRNSMPSGNVTGVFIDAGSNILPGDILPGADYNYTGVTTGTHSIEATLSGVSIGTWLEAKQIRGASIIQAGQFAYPGRQFQMIASAGFLPGDIFEISFATGSASYFTSDSAGTINIVGQNTGFTASCTTPGGGSTCNINNIPYDTYNVSLSGGCPNPLFPSFSCNGITQANNGNFVVTIDQNTTGITCDVSCI